MKKPSLHRHWYNNEDKQSTILIEWKSMRFTEELSNNPDESKVYMFWKLLSKLVLLQKQLDSNYHHDRLLRHRLITAVDISSIQIALLDLTLRTDHQLTKRIVDRLSGRPRLAQIAYISRGAPCSIAGRRRSVQTRSRQRWSRAPVDKEIG